MRSSVRAFASLVLVLSAAACSKGGGAAAQKGVPAGNVVVGYMSSAKPDAVDECAVITTPSAEKAKMTDQKLGELATVFGSKIVPSCPMDKVVGTCDVMKGLLVNYSAPRHTAETAKAACAKDRGTWIP